MASTRVLTAALAAAAIMFAPAPARDIVTGARQDGAARNPTSYLQAATLASIACKRPF